MSASSQSLRLILILRMNLSFIASGPGQHWESANLSERIEYHGGFMFLAYQRFSLWEFYLSYTVPTRGKDKKRTATRPKTNDVIGILKWRHRVMSHLCIFMHFWLGPWEPCLKHEYAVFNGEQRNRIHYLGIWGWDGKIHPSRALFVIILQASWWQTMA